MAIRTSCKYKFEHPEGSAVPSREVAESFQQPLGSATIRARGFFRPVGRIGSVTAAGSERQVLTLGGVVVCALLLLSLSAPAALAQDKPEPGARTTKNVPPVERLWKEYPLNPTPADDTPSSTERPRSFTPRPGSTAALGEEDDGFPIGSATLVFVGVAMALFALLAFSVLTLTPWPRHAPQPAAWQLPRFRNAGSTIAAQRRRRLLPAGWRGDDDGGETPQTPSKPLPEVADVKVFLSRSLHPRSDPMSKQPEKARPESQTPDEREVVAHEPVNPDTADYAHVGEKVTAVLASAQAAAEQMVASAREEADRLRSDAQKQAAATTAKAKSESERMQRESGRLRLEADNYRNETRAEADGYAAGARTEAEAEAEGRLAEAGERAQAIIAEAEQRARYVEREEVRRQEALASGAKRYEERLKSLLEVFRGMTTQLEHLVPLDQGTKVQEAKAQGADNEEAARDAETPIEGLDDVLRPERQTEPEPARAKPR